MEGTAPPFTCEEVGQAVVAHYNGTVKKVTQLGSYSDQNFRLVLEIDGEEETRLLKIYNDGWKQSWLDSECAVLRHISEKSGGDIPTPKIITSLADQNYVTISHRGTHKLFRARMQTYLPGHMMCDEKKLSDELLYSFGETAARVDLALADFPPRPGDGKYCWDIRYVSLMSADIDLLPTEEKKASIRYILAETEKLMAEIEDKLPPTQQIHLDMNDMNVLVQNGAISGIIDWGFTTNGHRICDLAVAMSYCSLMSGEQVRLGHILAGYLSRISLTTVELKLLRLCGLARIAASVTVGYKNCQANPNNASLFHTQKNGWKFLNTWLAYSDEELLEMWRPIVETAKLDLSA